MFCFWAESRSGHSLAKEMEEDSMGDLGEHEVKNGIFK